MAGTRQATDHKQVEMIESGRTNPDPNLFRAGVRIGKLGEMNLIEISGTSDYAGAHTVPEGVRA